MAETTPNPFRNGTGCPHCKPAHGCNAPAPRETNPQVEGESPLADIARLTAEKAGLLSVAQLRGRYATIRDIARDASR